MVSYKKVGSMHHWRVGRFGGCFYIARNRYSANLPQVRIDPEHLTGFVMIASVAVATLVSFL